jgi:hypothetical protein
MNEKKTQLETITDILIRDAHIDNFRRLDARIADLKALGFESRTERLPNKNFVYHVTAIPKARQLSWV